MDEYNSSICIWLYMHGPFDIDIYIYVLDRHIYSTLRRMHMAVIR